MSASFIASLPAGKLVAVFNRTYGVMLAHQDELLFAEDEMMEKWEIQEIMPEIYELYASLEKDGVFCSPDDEDRLADLKNQVAIKEERIKKMIRAHPAYPLYRATFKIALRLRDEIHKRTGVDHPMWRKPMF